MIFPHRVVYVLVTVVCVCVCVRACVCVKVQAELKKRLWKWQTQGYLSYSKRRRTLFTESSTVTQISVLEKSSPKGPPNTDTLVNNTMSSV